MAEALRKLNMEGILYSRPPNIEASIDTLSALSREELVKRSEIGNSGDPEYVPSECLLYFVRRSRSNSTDQLFQALFKQLRQRICQVLPAADNYTSTVESTSVQYTLLELRDAVLDQFNELLCIDRTGYEDRLDFFEIRFAGAIANLRRTARKKILKNEASTEPLTSCDDTGVPSREVEEALARLRSPSTPENNASDYRPPLMAAIDTLPDDQRRIIEMLLQEIPIDSKEPGAVTITKTLGCTEKTVRNRRNRAYAKLKELLREELTL